LRASGYTPPNSPNDLQTMTKQKAVSALGSVVIEQIDGDGKMLERWTLWNAFITGVTYGDLSYDSEELTEITLTIRYDWAVLETANRSEAAVVGGGGKEFFKPGSR